MKILVFFDGASMHLCSLLCFSVDHICLPPRLPEVHRSCDAAQLKSLRLGSCISCLHSFLCLHQFCSLHCLLNLELHYVPVASSVWLTKFLQPLQSRQNLGNCRQCRVLFHAELLSEWQVARLLSQACRCQFASKSWACVCARPKSRSAFKKKPKVRNLGPNSKQSQLTFYLFLLIVSDEGASLDRASALRFLSTIELRSVAFIDSSSFTCPFDDSLWTLNGWSAESWLFTLSLISV